MKHEWQKGDIAGYEHPENGYLYGVVRRIGKDVLEAENVDDEDDVFEIPIEKADYYPPVEMDLKKFIRLIRYEITAQEFAGDVYPLQRFHMDEPYLIQAEDLLAAARKIKLVGREQAEKEWLVPMEQLDANFQIHDGQYFVQSNWELSRNVSTFAPPPSIETRVRYRTSILSAKK